MTIREMRLAAGLSQSELLKDCPLNMTKPLLSNIENGLCEPSQGFRAWVAARCGCPAEKTASGAAGAVITASTRRASNLNLDRHTRYTQIMGVLCRASRPMTAREIAYQLGYSDLNAVKPRLTELRDRHGRVQNDGKVKDKLTGKTVATWRAVI